MMKKMNLALISVFGLMVSASAFAEETAAAAHTAGNSLNLGSFAAFLGLGLAAFGGAISQARTASAALEGISRNPAAADKVFTPMIIGLALIESLVLYAFVVAFVKG